MRGLIRGVRTWAGVGWSALARAEAAAAGRAGRDPYTFATLVSRPNSVGRLPVILLAPADLRRARRAG